MLKLSSPRGLSATGMGPLVMAIEAFLFTLALMAHARWPTVTALPEHAALPLRAIGVLWLALGVVLWALTLLQFLRGFPRGQLLTQGAYALSRHPLYASLVAFIMPASGLLLGTWTLLLASAIGLWLTYLCVQREERELEREFGQLYADYRARTSWLLPYPPEGRWRRSGAHIGWLLVGAFLLYIMLPARHAGERATTAVQHSELSPSATETQARRSSAEPP